MKKFIILLTSLASLLMLCKPAFADDQPNWLDGLNVGGYASAGLTLPRDESASAALNEVSLLVTWNGDSRWRFFGELELEEPLIWNDDEQFRPSNSSLDLERLYMYYYWSERVHIRAGRFLIPNSCWNLLLAAPLVWTCTRPLATSRLFPAGTNVSMFFGAIPFLDGAFEYKLFA